MEDVQRVLCTDDLGLCACRDSGGRGCGGLKKLSESGRIQAPKASRLLLRVPIELHKSKIMVSSFIFYNFMHRFQYF